MIDINELTLGQIKEITKMLGQPEKQNTLNTMLDKKVIVRTHTAGCWFGLLAQKAGNEVILNDARRMWYWHAEKGISLSSCALYGVRYDKSKIVEPVESVWLEAIEIIPCTDIAITSLEGAPHVEAK